VILPLWLRNHHKLVRRAARIIRWPSERYLGKPAKFALEILGIRLTAKQEEILVALLKPDARVAVRSGHGVGKTFLGAIAALYWFACYPESRVILSAPVLRQVRDLIWRSIKILHANSGVCYQCREDGFKGQQCDHSTRLDGHVPDAPETGLVVGLREVKGFVAVTADTATGYMGTDQLWIGDEAGGLRDDWLEAAQAGCKGGGSILAIGNPTKNTGFHADAFRRVPKPGEDDFWTARFTISCFDTPNVAEDRIVIKGLVTGKWVRSCKILWGERSALYQIRVLGVHPEHAKGMLVSFGEIDLMHARWTPGLKPDAADGLCIGVDVAAFGRVVGDTMVSGSSGIAGDQWVFCVVRGDYVCEFVKFPTMTRDELLLRLVDTARKWRKYPTERVTVRYDAEGNEGKECASVLDSAQVEEGSQFSSWEIYGVKASTRLPPESPYGTVRDAMYANLAEWIRDEGSAPPDDELDDELVHTTWRDDPRGGKERIAEKVEIKKELPHGRSPDTAESYALAVWSGQVIGHTDRERERSPGFVPLWMQRADRVPRDRYDPGVRGYRKGGLS